MSERTRVTTSRLLAKKRSGEKITVLTAYDFATASFIDQAGIDMIIVSDAVGTVGLGRPEAMSVTVEEMIYHTRAVRNGAGACMVITTLPFGSFNSVEQAVTSATRLMKEGGADGVHLEGSEAEAPLARAVVRMGIPVLAHIGLTKQKIIYTGGFPVQGRDARGALDVVKDALAMADAGAFAVILECVPAALAEVITASLRIPTVGVGAGAGCNGQFLVTQDMLGLFKGLSPRFLKVYADLSQTIVTALRQFRQEVETGAFPQPEHTYSIAPGELQELLAMLRAQHGD